MDPGRGRELLARERAHIEDAIAAVEREGPLEGSSRLEPGDYGSEDLYLDELNQGRLEELHRELAAVKLAEERLAAGTYGLGAVASGQPIPDERLEAVPTAEGSLEEESDDHPQRQSHDVTLLTNPARASEP